MRYKLYIKNERFTEAKLMYTAQTMEKVREFKEKYFANCSTWVITSDNCRCKDTEIYSHEQDCIYYKEF